jgi:hypothetical protein
MNLETLQAAVAKWAGAAKAALEAGKDVAPFIQIAFATFAGGGVTDEKLAALQAFNDAKHDELQAPLEPETDEIQGGDQAPKG